MTARIETIMTNGGLEITRLVTADSNIVVPRDVQGVPVVSLGEMFLRDSHGGGSRNLIIPASVVRASPEALVSASGLRNINFMGNFDTFNGFGWNVCTDCHVSCADGFSFSFLAEYPLCFPDFDDEILASHQRISEEIAMARLTNPVKLTEENRNRYAKYMRSRSLPMAEHAVIENDTHTLLNILETELLSDEDVRGLLINAVRSGRTPVTSLIMTYLNSKYSENE